MICARSLVGLGLLSLVGCQTTKPPAPPTPAAPVAQPATPVSPAAPVVPAPGPAPPAAPAPSPPAAQRPAPTPQAQPSPAPPSQTATVAPEPKVLYVKTHLANLREGGGTSMKILRVLRQGTRLVIVEDHGDWLRVKLDDGQEGWVASSVTTPTAP